MQEPRQLHSRSLDNAAFSLIELLVVVALLVVLTTVYWNQFNPQPSKHDRELAACSDNLQKIYLAMEIYAHDNAGKFPIVTNAATSEDALAPLVPHYTSDTSIFICPATHDSQLSADETFRQWKISYAYYMGRGSADSGQALMSDAQINLLPKNAGSTVFSETGKPPGNNHGKGGGNFLMCDGSVNSSSGNAPISLIFTPPVVLLNPKP